MTSAFLVRLAADHAREILETQLPPHMYFHNLTHTQNVVSAVKEIGGQSRLGNIEMMGLEIAAWFHDTGYCYTYNGHEETSCAIASTFLVQNKCGENFINEVAACIMATRVPQNPQNLQQQIICDADMFHLAQDDYVYQASQLRLEWAHQLNKHFTDKDWTGTNISLLMKHDYFTSYGKTTLQPGKLKNIDRLLSA